MSSPSPHGPTAISSRHSKRSIPRVSVACDACRTRKARCNGARPCAFCVRQNSECTYRTGKPRGRKKRSKPAECSMLPDLRPRSDNSSPYQDDQDTQIQRDRLRELRAGIGVYNSDSGGFQFHGPSSYYCFLQRIYRRIYKRDGDDLMLRKESNCAEGVRKWGLEKFIFSSRSSNQPAADKSMGEALLPKELGDTFMSAYFNIIHPQIPVLLYSEVRNHWFKLWEPPGSSDRCTTQRALVLMVLAIGAQVATLQKSGEAECYMKWAEYFSDRAQLPPAHLQEPTLEAVHFYLLKAMYYFTGMRYGDGYIYIGYAARSAHSLGFHTSQVTSGSNANMNRVRLTFWSIFSLEKLSSLFSGRPSSLVELQIDAEYPVDLTATGECPTWLQPVINNAYTRVTVEIGKIADRILNEIYPLGEKRTEHSADYYDELLESTVATLPRYLCFQDSDIPLGESWQEIQRLYVGIIFYLTRVLIHRPALISVAIFGHDDDPDQAASLQKSIDIACKSSTSLIQLVSEACQKRTPNIQDGGVAFYLISACVTLLYDVLDLKTSPERAKATFEVVESGIRCLDKMAHIGPTTGKALSLEIMKVAKGALCSGSEDFIVGGDFTQMFPWLNDITCEMTGPYQENQMSSMLESGLISNFTDWLSEAQFNIQPFEPIQNTGDTSIWGNELDEIGLPNAL